MKKTKLTPEEQLKAFKQAARELGCDDDEKAFDKKLKKVATPKPKKPRRDSTLL